MLPSVLSQRHCSWAHKSCYLQIFMELLITASRTAFIVSILGKKKKKSTLPSAAPLAMYDYLFFFKSGAAEGLAVLGEHNDCCLCS